MHYLFSYANIHIGFCGRQCPLERNNLGWEDNSIGTMYKEAVWIDGSWIKFGIPNEYFKKWDVAGIGIIIHPNSKMECFLTANGKLQGKIKIIDTKKS